MAHIAKKTKLYPSNLTDEGWDRMSPLTIKPGHRRRPSKVNFRKVIIAVRYFVGLGRGWRILPIHIGAWQPVDGWFRELARRFLFQAIHGPELTLERERLGQRANPSAAVIDSQAVTASSTENRWFDATKKIVGRERNIAVDTDERCSWSTSPRPTFRTAQAHRPSLLVSSDAWFCR